MIMAMDVLTRVDGESSNAKQGKQGRFSSGLAKATPHSTKLPEKNIVVSTVPGL